MRKKRRAVLAGALACALIFPAVALAASDLLDQVTYNLPPGWTSEKESDKDGPPFGDIRLASPSTGNSADNAAGVLAYIIYDKAQRFATLEQFSAYDSSPAYDNQGDTVEKTTAHSEAVTFKGKPAWKQTMTKVVTTHNLRTTENLGVAPVETGRRIDTTYYFNTEDGHSVLVISYATALGSKLNQIDTMQAQAEDLIDSIKFGSPPPPTPEGSPWRTVFEGAAALAAAATALVGAFLSTPEGRRRAKEDPTMVVGHILRLSTRSIDVTRDKQTPLEVLAYRVRANGSYELADDAVITLTPPAGVSAAPQSGSGTLNAGVWQTGTVGRPAIMQISAAASTGSTTQQLPVKSGDALELIVTFEPATKTSLLADDKDSTTLIARVQPEGGAWAPGSDPSAARASIAFRILGGWLYGSEPADWGADARAMRFMACQPDPLHPVVPPDHIDVEVTAAVGTEQLRKVVAVGIARQPVLDATPDEITLAAESGETATVKLEVRDPGEPQWHYDREWPKDTHPPAECDFSEDSLSTGTLTLTECAPIRSGGGGSPKVWAKLTVIARADGYADVPRVINVGVLREGLFAETVSLHPDGTYHVRADGKKQPQTIVFRAYVRDPSTGRIAATPQFMNALKFEMVDDPGTPERASAEFSQLAIAYQPEASASEREPGGAYSFAFTREVPGNGDVRPVRYLVTAPGLDPEKYWCEVKLGLETTAIEPPSPAWQAEYQRADDILKRLMPASYYPKWKQTLDTRSQFLGAEGMAELRKRIWINATELVLAEGAEGYVAEANWADHIVQSLEIADMAGDVAIQYLCSIYLGPAGGQAAQTVKPILTSAIGEYLAGMSADEWIHMQIASLGGILESRTVDVSAWEKMVPNRKWTLWALFVCYHFLRATLYEGKSFMEGIKRAALQAGGGAIMGWTQKMLHQYGGTTAYANAPTTRVTPKEPKPVVTPRKRVLDSSAPVAAMAKPGKPVKPLVPTGTPKGPQAPESASAARIRAATTVGPDGVPMADRATVLATMRDPAAVRALKTASPEIQAAFNNTRNQIYRQHDADVLRDLHGSPGMEGKRLAVVDVRTPGSDPNSVNTDRDFRVVEIRRDPATGRTEAIEIDRRRWETSSDKAFAKATGGPANDRAAARQYAKDHQQNATDQYHAEASPDLAMQGYVKDSSGQWRQTQVKPNIQIVAEGKGRLHDPEALGKTYETKVNEAIHSGNQGEAYVQAGKAVETMTHVRAGYAKQNLAVGELPPAMRKGMAIVGEGKANYGDPAAVAATDAKLRSAGFSGGLSDFIGKVSGQIEALKGAKPR